ncbi:MAG: gliding motility-associated C-terminal domain-containing protein [Saprospiraceae bacterium]|nr:gliding motility-associated C-terminal domain-containing protein [Saprospiraceae bacterium]
MKSCIFCVLLTTICVTIALAQKENNNWYINGGIILNFNEVPLRTDSISAWYYTDAYNATVSDSNGNLLFFATHQHILDKNGIIIPNSTFNNTELFTSSCLQPVVAFPNPDNPNQYYIFRIKDGFGRPSSTRYFLSGELYYSVIDMTLNEGRGSVLPSATNILLAKNLTGAMVAVQGYCGSIWLVVHEVNSNRFLAFEVSDKGIGTPIISEVGTNIDYEGSKFVTDGSNSLFAHPAQNKLVSFDHAAQATELFDFNRNTGKISNPVSLPIRFPVLNANGNVNNYYTKSGSFSPQGKYFYTLEVTEMGSRIIRFDVSSNEATTIQNSKTVVDSIPRWSPFNFFQRAWDGNIYCTVGRIIFSIAHPDDIYSTIVTDSLIGNSTSAFAYNLPNLTVVPTLPITQDSMLLLQDTSLCIGQELKVSPRLEGDHYLWQDGSTDRDYIIKTPGTYTVQVQKGNCNFLDTLEVASFEVTVTLPNDTTICQGEAFELIPITNTSNLIWQDGTTNPSYAVLKTGLYTVAANTQGCSASDSIFVEIIEMQEQVLPQDTTLCIGQTLILTIPNENFDDILWNDQIHSNSFDVKESGRYQLTLVKDGCVQTGTFNVRFEDCENQLKTPNLFSPNGDNQNDKFRVLSLAEVAIASFEIKIYNRWGDLVFQSNDINDGWDGTKHGDGITALPSDVYVYYYAVQLIGTSEKTIKKRTSNFTALVKLGKNT